VRPGPVTATSDVMVSESGAVCRVYTRPTVTSTDWGPAVQVVLYAGASVQVPSKGPSVPGAEGAEVANSPPTAPCAAITISNCPTAKEP
jgi:hypothetical protein